MHKLTKESFLRHGAVLHSGELPRCCMDCARSDPGPGGCQNCGGFGVAWKCPTCDLPLRVSRAVYCARSVEDKAAEAELPCDECPGCGVLYLWRRLTDPLEDLVAAAPSGFRILPEHGFVSTAEIEVFSFVEQLPDRRVREVRRRRAGLELRFGPSSRFFSEHVDHFTSLNVRDHALDEMPTIRIRPPPPYTADQVSSLRILVARLQVALHDRDSEGDNDEETEAALILLRTILLWKADHDGRAASLATSLHEASHPGRLVNAYRLLELVLERLLDAEIGRRRRDAAFDDRSFIELAGTYKADLKTRLRRRVEALSVHPIDVLSHFWHSVRPQAPFDERGVFEAIVTFRNRHVHRPEESEQSLPWEQPDFEFVSLCLMRLIVHILLHDLGGVSERAVALAWPDPSIQWPEE